METDAARAWLIKASLAATGVAFVFYLIAPACGYPLTYDQTPRIFEVILPLFLGYIGTATHFLFHQGTRRAAPITVSSPLLRLIIQGPIYVFAFGWLAVTIAFGLSNRVEAASGSGMSIDQMAAFLTSLLGLLAVSTGVAVSYLFSLEKR